MKTESTISRRRSLLTRLSGRDEEIPLDGASGHAPSALVEQKRRKRSAFTLIELVVVIAVVAGMLTILVPSVTTSLERHARAKCATNIRQQLCVFTAFGEDNNGLVHAGSVNSGGMWLWDIDNSHRDLLIEDYGLTREVMYDPSFPEQNDDAHWDFWYGDYTVGGYWMVMVRTSSNGDIVVPAPITNQKYREDVIVNGSGYVSILADLVHPSRTAMVTDATISAGPTNFVQIGGGSPITHRTPHVDPATFLPAGFNVGHADGSVVWKPFVGQEENLMITRFPMAWW